MALARTQAVNEISLQQETIAAQKALQLGAAHSLHSATLQRNQQAEWDQALDEYLNQASHFLWQHRDGIVAGFGIMGMAMGVTAPRFTQLGHESVVAGLSSSTQSLNLPKFDNTGRIIGWESAADIAKANQPRSGFDQFMSQHHHLFNAWLQTKYTGEQLTDFALNSPFGGLEHAGEAVISSGLAAVAKTGLVGKLSLFGSKFFSAGVVGKGAKQSLVNKSSIGLTSRLNRSQLRDYLSNAHTIPREQLIKDLESIGFKLRGQSPNGLFKTFEDKTGNLRIKIHPPDPSSNYSHIHVYDKSGNSLTADLMKAPHDSPKVHIEIDPIQKELEWRPTK